MAWTNLPLFADGNELTANEMNELSENLVLTMPGVATVANRLFYATGANAIAETGTPEEGDLLVAVDGVPTMHSPATGSTDLSQVPDYGIPTWGALRQTFKAV